MSDMVKSKMPKLGGVVSFAACRTCHIDLVMSFRYHTKLEQSLSLTGAEFTLETLRVREETMNFKVQRSNVLINLPTEKKFRYSFRIYHTLVSAPFLTPWRVIIDMTMSTFSRPSTTPYQQGVYLYWSEFLVAPHELFTTCHVLHRTRLDLPNLTRLNLITANQEG